MADRYNDAGYRRDGRRKITTAQAPDRPGLDEYYALQNRSIPAFRRPNGPMSAGDVAGSYYNQGISLGPSGTSPRNYGAPQRSAPGSSSRSYTPIYTSDNVDSSSFGAQISQARRRAENGNTGVYTPPAMRNAPSPINFADDLGSNSLLGVGGYKSESPMILQNDFEDVQTFIPPRASPADQASENRASLELLRDAKRGNVVTNKTSDGSQITSKYGTATVKNLTPEQFASRPQATIEGMPASEWFKRSAARQNLPNEFSTVAQGQDFVGDQRRRDESDAAKKVAEGNKISDELRKRRVPSARNA